MLLLSVVKALEMIGEAASKVNSETRDASPEIPWSEIVAMRNRLIHVYFDINADIVWQTLIDDIPALERKLQALKAIERGMTNDLGNDRVPLP